MLLLENTEVSRLMGLSGYFTDKMHEKRAFHPLYLVFQWTNIWHTCACPQTAAV